MKTEGVLRSLSYAFLFLLAFTTIVLAAHVVTTSTGGSSYSLNEDVTNAYNITVNNSDTAAAANITEVNITLPASFSYESGTNGTNAGTHTFTNTSTVLSWNNDGLVMNLTTQEFWFNATAATPGTYNITVTTTNVTEAFSSNIAVTVNDTTAPEVSFSNITNYGNYSGMRSILLNITDDSSIDTVWINITDEAGLQNATATATNTSANSWNVTINTTAFIDQVYNITAYVNDTAGNANNSVVTFNITFDNTDPVINFSCNPTTVDQGETVTCNCTATDAVSGVSDISFTTNPSTSSSGTKTTTCTVMDYAGNTEENSTNYEVEGSSSSSSGGGGGTGTSSKQKSSSWSVIAAGSTKTMKSFDSDFGIHEIDIQVDSKATNAKVTVKRYVSKPTSVTEKSGDVYKYLEITTENLESELETATVMIKVTKSWLNSKSLTKDDVVMAKYNETTKKWKEQPTTHTREDSTYHYYEVELTSFSYFTIAEKVAEEKKDTEDDGEGEDKSGPSSEGEDSAADTTSETSPGISKHVKRIGIWVLIIGVIIIVGIGGYFAYKQYTQKKKKET